MKRYWLKFHAMGQRSIRVEPRGMVRPIRYNLFHWKQDGSAHTTWYTKVKVGNFCWTTWYGSANRSGNDIKMAGPVCTSTYLIFCKLFEGIWNNYVDIEQKIMQIRFIIFLCTWGYISLGDLTWQHKVWRKTRLNTNWSKQHLTATAQGEQNDLNFC